MGFRRRRLLTAAAVANTFRPAYGLRPGIPSMFVGWIAAELAPHLLALTALDTVGHVTAAKRAGRPVDGLGTALGLGAAAGFAMIIKQSQDAREEVDAALREGLGADYRTRLDREPTDLDLATPWRQVLMPFRMRDDAVRVARNIAYSDAGRRGLLDVYRPADRPVEGAPVLLQVHGGGWAIGNKDQQGIPLMQHMAARGWVCVSINYRLSPRDAFPAHIIDVKRAIAWIREHIEEYGGDPSFLAITGGSAGGQLAALAATTPNDPAYQPGFEDADTSVDACVPFYGVYDFAGVTGRNARDMRDKFLAPRIVQQTYADAQDVFEQASPILRITPDVPPFLVIHGAHDTLVSVRQARKFVERLREASKKPVVYAELPGTQHAFDVFPSIRSAHVVRAVDRFLHVVLNDADGPRPADAPD
ncbi:alpha/beta hydrolase [Nocardioides massiliensis]|uniref:Acetyl esterase/lipase n=1 Tax=Nocardioides massiliensis TaxID=1325935 RepID=A0ABT9NRX1_9ACTN|nr:alpha/beta hydrolase [Nocardioides massiliensis]MDP9823181.1 acetyl esterase/lipase [Nocardioides massiliensis]